LKRGLFPTIFAVACLQNRVSGSRLARNSHRWQRSTKTGHLFGVALTSDPVVYRQELHNFQNVQYFADFDIGGQKITGIFDTGSFELLVRSTRCRNCMHPTAPYDSKKSKTFVKNGTIARHVFGSGPCISMLGYESVSVGAHLQSPRQAFWEIVDHRISALDTAKFAAIVGIGPDFARDEESGMKSLLTNFGVQEFSVCLQRSSGSSGFLTWGPIKQATIGHGNSVVSARVLGKRHWATHLHNVTFVEPSGHLVLVPCGNSEGCAAIIDSGTSLIAAPSLALMQLSSQIPQIMENCSNLHKLPILHFVIDGKPFELPPQAYVMRVTGATLEANDIWDILFFKPKIRKLDMCMPAFMQLDMMSQFGPVWILGMPFFRYYHTTFDMARKQMRFAKAGSDCNPVPFKVNRTQAFLVRDHGRDDDTMRVDVSALMPPTLSGMMDTGKMGTLYL